MDTIYIPEKKYVEFAMPANEFAMMHYFLDCVQKGSAVWGNCSIPEANVEAGKYFFSYKVVSDNVPAIAPPSGWLYVLFHSFRNNKDVLLAAHTRRLPNGRVEFSCDLETEKLADIFASEGWGEAEIDSFVNQLGLRYLRIVDWINGEMLKEREKVERAQNDRQENGGGQKRGNKAKPQKRVVKVGSVKYVHVVSPSGSEDKQKRAFERHVEAWRVRGHIRHLKSGKEVFVHPYVKGDKSKIVDKDYVVGGKTNGGM